MMRAIALLLPLLLTACIEAAAPPRGIPPLNFRQFQPIYFNVKQIDVVEEYRSPMRAPNVEHDMHYTPADVVHIWTRDRLRATDGNKTMQVVIKDASVIEKQLNTETSMFSDDITRRYDARLDIDIRIYGDGALSEANVNVVANRSLSIPESMSARAVEVAYYHMLKEMMTLANAELEKNMYKHLGAYINYSVSP
jgi:hypothetical protein